MYNIAQNWGIWHMCPIASSYSELERCLEIKHNPSACEAIFFTPHILPIKMMNSSCNLSEITDPVSDIPVGLPPFNRPDMSDDRI